MWYNPVVTDTYEPGSTFKLMNVATAYQLGVVHAEDTFYCGGDRWSATGRSRSNATTPTGMARRR